MSNLTEALSFTNTDARKVTLENYKVAAVIKGDGEVIPWQNFELPSVLREPLVYVPGDGAPQIVSGARSGLVHVDSRWFKLKGNRPPKDYSPNNYGNDEPGGAMSEEAARQELEATGRIAKIMREYGFNPPHMPAALVKYNVEYNNEYLENKKWWQPWMTPKKRQRSQREHCFAAILQTYGETRPVNCKLTNTPPLFSKYCVEPPLHNSTPIWLGFAMRVFKEAGLNINLETIDPGNVACYQVNGGYGIFRIDHEDTTIGSLHKKCLERTLAFCPGPKDKRKRFYDAFDGKVLPEPIPAKEVLAYYKTSHAVAL